jgi:hypothetical protein
MLTEHQVMVIYMNSVSHVHVKGSIYHPTGGWNPIRESFYDHSSGLKELSFDRWRFFRTIVMDGNYKADHLITKRPEEDIRIVDGEGFFASVERYQYHVKNSIYHKEVKFLQYWKGLSS